MSNLVAKVGLSSLLHLGQDHGGYFLRSLFMMSAKCRVRESRYTYKVPQVAPVVDLDHGFALLVNDLERPVPPVALDIRVVKVSTDQSLRVENGVLWVIGGLVLSGVTNKSLFIGESDP